MPEASWPSPHLPSYSFPYLASLVYCPKERLDHGSIFEPGVIQVLQIEIPDAVGVEITDEALTVELSDGRTVSVPLAWHPRLLHATPKERGNWRSIGKGQGIHWDALDEDINVEGLLAGRHSGESQTSFKRWLEGRAKRP